jgi:hypothetical protein
MQKSLVKISTKIKQKGQVMIRYQLDWAQLRPGRCCPKVGSKTSRIRKRILQMILMHHKWYDTHDDKARCPWNFTQKCGSSKKNETFWFSYVNVKIFEKGLLLREIKLQPVLRLLGQLTNSFLEPPTNNLQCSPPCAKFMCKVCKYCILWYG